MSVRYQRVRQLRRGFAGVTTSIGVIALVIAASPAALATPVVAPAHPGVYAADPTNTEDAKKAWLDAEQKAGALNEEVLIAQEAAAQAEIKVQRTALAVAKSEAAASVAKLTAATAATKAKAAADVAEKADKQHAAFQHQVDEYINASVRGSDKSALNSLLSSDTAEDYLIAAEQSRLAADDINATLTKVAEAKAVADKAKEAAQAAVDNASVAAKDAVALNETAVKTKDAAVQTQTAAKAAADAVTARQRDLQSEANQAKALFDRLSQQERQSALTAQVASREGAAPARADRSEHRADPDAAAAPFTMPNVSGAAADAVRAALSKNGATYIFGANGPDAFDCSGLTSWAWAQAGVSIPRTSRGQAGLPTVPLDQLQPGDLVTYYSPVSHVGMYIGDGQVIHASTPRTGVYITSVAGGGPNPTGHRVEG